MARRSLPPLLLLASVLVLPALPASAGGGGCHGQTTAGEGTTVEMVEACFTPTTLHVDPGDTVTFVNRSSMVHNVTANGWGRFEDIARGDAFEATFDEAGVFPYACSYHPGMSGAVVVGDGEGSGSGASVSVVPFEPPTAPSPEVVVETVRVRETSPAGWWIGGGLGVALGLVLGFVLRRRTALVRGTRVEPA